MKKLYLCGAINGCTDSQAKDWRELVKKELAGLYEFLDPMRRDYRGKEDDSVNEIVSGDITDIDNSDILIVAADYASWGTAMELHYAHGARKTTIVVCGSARISPWLRYHASRLVSALPDAIALLKEMAC